jgi:hypothetical protein
MYRSRDGELDLIGLIKNHLGRLIMESNSQRLDARKARIADTLKAGNADSFNRVPSAAVVGIALEA